MPGGHIFLDFAGPIALITVLAGILLAFVRLVKGPDAADRIVALDLISVLIVAFLAAYSIYSRETSFLDVAIAYALIAFLGTAALARFLMRSPKATREQQKVDREDNE